MKNNQNHQNPSYSQRLQPFPSPVQPPANTPNHARQGWPQVPGYDPSTLGANNILNQSPEELSRLIPSPQSPNHGNAWVQQSQADLSFAQVAQQPSINSQHVYPSSLKQRWRKHWKLTILCSLFLVLLMGTISYAFLQFKYSTPDVTLYHVNMKSLTENVGSGGIAYPEQRLDLSYPFTAFVLAVFVKPGDEIKLGQPLVQIDLSQVNAQNIDKLGSSPKADAPALPNGNIVSTMSGTVTSVNVFPGQLFPSNKVMLTIYEEANIIVHANFPVANYGQVRVNQKAQVIPSALPNLSLNGIVTSIILNADSQAATFGVWVTVPNTTDQLLAGMSTFVQIQVPVHGLIVPRLAVLNPDQDSIVFVVRKQHAYIQHVQVAGYVGDTLLIGSGLNVNDLVVLVGLDSLSNGQAVHVTSVEN